MAIQKIISVEGASVDNVGGTGTLTADRIDLTLGAGTLQFTNQDRLNPINTVRFLPSVSSGTNQAPQALTGNNSCVASTSIVDNNRLVLACGVMATTTIGVTEIAGFAGAGSTRITFGLNGRFVALYVDGTVVATSSFDALDGNGFNYYELFIDKSVPRVYLYANGDLISDAAISGGVALNSARLSFGQFPSSVIISDICIFDNEVPRGPMYIHGFYANANPTSQFTGSLTTVNTRPFVNGTFRNSTTLGQQDLYTYSQITNNYPSGSNVKFVHHQVVASSDGSGGGLLNLRTRVNSVNYDVSVSSQLTSTTPVFTRRTLENNPNSGAVWTLTDIQTNLSNGYVIAA